MIVKSIKHVGLPDETYHGLWCGWTVTIPVIEGDTEKDLEFPVSHTTPTTEAIAVKVKVVNHSFSFERTF
jgi:hypothetical protein